jgi:selenocysteine-specific elongation factor
MHVVATAGHVDHGKSTLVRRLTGMEPDRWAEERRRGLTIDLGFAWTGLPGGGRVAFVDVPGHERFVPNMLAGVGPVPAVLFVVAADGGWCAQSAEHLAALDALGVRHGLLAVTRSDLADPGPALATAAARLAATSLGAVPAVAVSGATGAGLDDLRAQLAKLVARLPEPDPAADVRLWVDRSFPIRGAGTVVTGTLPAGTLRVGDELELPGTGTVRIRGLQALAQPETAVTGVARVAVNLRAIDYRAISRGDALLTPGAWHVTSTVDVALRPAAPPDHDPPPWTYVSPSRPANKRLPRPDPRGTGSAVARKPAERTSAADPPRTASAVQPPADPVPDSDPLWTAGVVDLPAELVLHVGSAAVPVRVRPLGTMHARLALARPLPLRAGDRGLLRDPGQHRIVAGVRALDVAPPPLSRRGAAARRGAELAAAGDDRALTFLVLRHRGFADAAELSRLGLPAVGLPVGGGWLADEPRWTALMAAAGPTYADWSRQHPLAAGMPTDTLRRTLELPDASLVGPVAAAAGLIVENGHVRRPEPAALPPAVDRAVRTLERDLAAAPYAAPDAHRLAALGLGPRELAAAARAGRLLRLADGIVLLPGADTAAAGRLAALAQPFTLSQARQALATTRRVAVPLLEHLARTGLTEHLPDATHRVAHPTH